MGAPYSDDPQRDIYGVNRYETVPSGVVREEVAFDNSRLDIVIPTTNDFIVAIENKLFATVNNPLDSYHEWINAAYKYENNVEVLLSLKPVGDETILTGKDSHGSKYHFVNITYKDLFSAVKTNVGTYLSGASEKWLIYMNEFMKNIESLQEGNMSIDKEWQLFLEENNDLIGDYNRKIQNDHKAKVELVKHFAKNLQERFDSEATGVSTDAYIFGTQSFAKHISLVIDISVGDKKTIAFEPCFLKPGVVKEDYQRLGVFYVSFWIRQRDYREEGIAWLEKVLTKSSIVYVVRQSPDWGTTLEIKQFDYTKEVDDQEVENYIFDVWKIIVKEIRSERETVNNL